MIEELNQFFFGKLLESDSENDPSYIMEEIKYLQQKLMDLINKYNTLSGYNNDIFNQPILRGLLNNKLIDSISLEKNNVVLKVRRMPLKYKRSNIGVYYVGASMHRFNINFSQKRTVSIENLSDYDPDANYLKELGYYKHNNEVVHPHAANSFETVCYGNNSWARDYSRAKTAQEIVSVFIRSLIWLQEINVNDMYGTHSLPAIKSLNGDLWYEVSLESPINTVFQAAIDNDYLVENDLYGTENLLNVINQVEDKMEYNLLNEAIRKTKYVLKDKKTITREKAESIVNILYSAFLLKNAGKLTGSVLPTCMVYDCRNHIINGPFEYGTDPDVFSSIKNLLAKVNPLKGEYYVP